MQKRKHAVANPYFTLLMCINSRGRSSCLPITDSDSSDSQFICQLKVEMEPTVNSSHHPTTIHPIGLHPGPAMCIWVQWHSCESFAYVTAPISKETIYQLEETASNGTSPNANYIDCCCITHTSTTTRPKKWRARALIMFHYNGTQT